ncbi:MAG: hypothetical protein JWM57_4200 [Phycisphaerales bacterium]|nr:hypothetical protein [Phycisphaerales bacterium]
MAEGAKVQDLDVIRSFRASMIKFIEASNAALTDGESDLTRRQAWCEGEQTSFWNHQIKKLNELIMQLKEAIRGKQIFRDSTGRTQSAFDEQKKLRAAQARLELAEQKLANCRRWGKQLQREHLNYRGGVQRLQTMLSSDLVNSVATLETILTQLDAYLSAGAPSLATSEASPTPPSEMRRSPDEAPVAATKEAADAERKPSENESSEPKEGA